MGRLAIRARHAAAATVLVLLLLLATAAGATSDTGFPAAHVCLLAAGREVALLLAADNAPLQMRAACKACPVTFCPRC